MRVAIAKADSYEACQIQASLVQLFEMLGYEKDNPLGGLVKPGDTVFIKPNWVNHEFRKSCKIQDDIYCCITHPALIRAMADFVAIALKGNGRIIIGDNPSIDADFDKHGVNGAKGFIWAI